VRSLVIRDVLEREHRAVVAVAELGLRHDSTFIGYPGFAATFRSVRFGCRVIARDGIRFVEICLR
jgi:hypothetical protein